MPFTSSMSGTTELDSSLVSAFDQSFIIANAEESMFTEAGGLIAYKRDIGAKSIQLTKYTQLNLIVDPLTEDEDAASVAMDDSAIILTPKEFGNVVTRTNLAQLQTGGKADTAAAQLVGKNLGRSMNKIALNVAEGATAYNVDGIATGSLVATDVMTRAHLNIMYNKLARANVPTINGLYVAVLHEDVIHDLREETGTASWIEVSKYSGAETIMKNEVGMMAGFRILRNNECTIDPTGGVTNVDTYKSTFFGFNGLGLAVSQEPRMHLSGPFDKLGRFVNVGWYGVFEFKIIDSTAIWSSETASSVGSN